MRRQQLASTSDIIDRSTKGELIISLTNFSVKLNANYTLSHLSMSSNLKHTTEPTKGHVCQLPVNSIKLLLVVQTICIIWNLA